MIRDAAQMAVWQTGTAIVQAVCSMILLGWYVLAAHLDRSRTRREKIEDFRSLVRLCRDLGIEAKDKTRAHLDAASCSPRTPAVGSDPKPRFVLWRADMTVIYVCLNEVPHYEVRNPAFSTALTRLWMEVDARSADPASFERPDQLVAFLSEKYDRICVEVDAMADLLTNVRIGRVGLQTELGGAAKRRGYAYTPDGFPQGQEASIVCNALSQRDVSAAAPLSKAT